MKIKLLLLLLTIAYLPLFVQAQQTSKMNFDLVQKVNNPSVQNDIISVFVKGTISHLINTINEAEGTISCFTKDVAVVRMPVRNLKTLASQNFVTRIEAYTPRNVLMSDSMRIKAKVDLVHAGQLPLPQGYDGTDVVVGIIDSGIDFNNPDFKDSNGKTRIKFLWDHTKPNGPNTPQPYNFGQEWTNTEIDLGQCTHTDIAHFGHGTISSGISASNGNSSIGNKYKGVAPNADLIVVAYDFNNAQATDIAIAADYIFAKAQQLGKPCVINISIGDYWGSHDGTDAQAQLLDNLVNAAPGRVITASAGNAGDKRIHLGYNVSNTDTNFTWFKGNNAYFGGAIYMQLWGNSGTFENVNFSVGVDKVNPNYSFRGETPYYSITPQIGKLAVDTIKNGGNRIGIVQSYGDIVGGNYSMEFYIKPDSVNYNWRLTTTGIGRFDLWSFDPSRQENTDMEFATLPSIGTFPPIAKYISPDSLQNICSSFQCSNSIITVGNYNNKRSYVDFNSILQIPFPGINPGHIDVTSSLGPTRDGRTKPDIAAPGALTMTSGVMSIMADWQTSTPQKLDETGVNVRGGGTSTSSPVVAGIVALYLQKNPTASMATVKSAITACPITDSLTGTSLPNNTFGYGKVDAFTTLAGCTVGTNKLIGTFGFSIYPNPFNDQTTINYNFTELGTYKTAQVKIYDVVGKLVKTILLNHQVSHSTISKEQLQSGSYFYTLVIDDKLMKTDKLLVLD